ncbi:MAG: hypothetical protein ACON4H_09195 [Rubripirellula sp.]
MITQKMDPSIHRRVKAISVFLVLDDVSEGENFAIHQQIYVALERGELTTAGVQTSSTFNTEVVAR